VVAGRWEPGVAEDERRELGRRQFWGWGDAAASREERRKKADPSLSLNWLIFGGLC
jgi:hypothetical protein